MAWSSSSSDRPLVSKPSSKKTIPESAYHAAKYIIAGWMAAIVAFGLTTSDEPTISASPRGPKILPKFTDAKAKTHAARAQARRPNLCRIGPDDGVTAIAKHPLAVEHQIKDRNRADESRVEIAGKGQR